MANVLNGQEVTVDKLILDEEWVSYEKEAFASVGKGEGITLHWHSAMYKVRSSERDEHMHTTCYPTKIVFDSSIVSMAEAIRILEDLNTATNNGFDLKCVTEEGSKVTVTLPFN